MKKCIFFKLFVKYLGYVVSKNGISIDEEKIKCIINWKVFEIVKEVKLFLGFVGYYCCFICYFFQIVVFLLEIFKNNMKYFKIKFGDKWFKQC